MSSGVTSIGNYAFYSCSGLATVINFNPTPVSIASGVFYGRSSTCKLMVPAASLGLYRTAPGWKDFYQVVGIDTYTLTFVATGGTVSPSDKTVTYGLPVGELPMPTRTDHTFTEWNTVQDGNGNAYTTATVYTQTDNTTLYAQWTSNSGIEDVESVAVLVYPNPVKNDLYLQSDFPIERVELYSQTGVLVKIETDVMEKIDVSALVEGMYLARIYGGNQVVVRKVIVRK
jgi:uncharacterized repeat protein (TIGR02543 family)